MEFALGYLVKELLRAIFMPPGGLILLLLLGLWHWRSVWGKAWIATATLLLYLFSTPFIAQAMLDNIEPPALDAHASFEQIDAIVCLGGGKRFGAVDLPQGEAINNENLARVRYAARLHHLSGKPLLVSGGKPTGGIAEAKLMRDALVQDFRVPVRWVEDQSNDTSDNASLSAALLLPKQSRILLVTSASHMPRAQRAFEAEKFTVTAAPTDYTNREALSLLSFLPRASSFVHSNTALREWIGSAWYWTRSKTTQLF